MGIVIIAAPALIDRSMTNYWAGVSRKRNIIIPRWRPNKKRKGHLSPRSETSIYHLPPCFLLVTTFNIFNIIANAVCWAAGGTPPSSTTAVARPPSTSPASASTSLPSTPEPRRSPPRYDNKEEEEKRRNPEELSGS